MPWANSVAPPCDGCLTATASTPSPASAACEIRPTPTTTDGEIIASTRSRKGTPAATSAAEGRRFESGRPATNGCVGTVFQRTTSCSAPSSSSVRWTIVPDGSLQPFGLSLVVRNGGPQRSRSRSLVNAMPDQRAPW